MRPPGDFPSQSMPPPSTHYQLSPPRAPPPPTPGTKSCPCFLLLFWKVSHSASLGWGPVIPCLPLYQPQLLFRTSSRLGPIQRHPRETRSDSDNAVISSSMPAQTHSLPGPQGLHAPLAPRASSTPHLLLATAGTSQLVINCKGCMTLFTASVPSLLLFQALPLFLA